MQKPPPQVAVTARPAALQGATAGKVADEPSLIFSAIAFVVAVGLLLLLSATALFGVWIFLTPAPSHIVAGATLTSSGGRPANVALNGELVQNGSEAFPTDVRPPDALAEEPFDPVKATGENLGGGAKLPTTGATTPLAAKVEIQFNRGSLQTVRFDNLQEAEWRLASMVSALAEAQQLAADDRTFTIGGFRAEVQVDGQKQAFTDPNAAYVYVLHTRTAAGLPAPVAGTEDYRDVIVALEPATSAVAVAPAEETTPIAPVVSVEPEAEPAAGEDTFACTIQSVAIKSPISVKSLDAADRRLQAFERAFERQYDDARSARLAEGFVAEIDVSGVLHTFYEPAQARNFVRNLKAAKVRGESLADVDPNAAVDDFDGRGEVAPVTEISQGAQTYMDARFAQAANAFLTRTRRFPTEFEMAVLRQQIFQEAQLLGLIPRDAVYPY